MFIGSALRDSDLFGRLRSISIKNDRSFETLWNEAFIQLYHPGASVQGMEENWSASPIPNPMSGVIPIEMTKGMIDDVIESFTQCRKEGERFRIRWH